MAVFCLTVAACAQTVNVTAHVSHAPSDVVIWLEPTGNTPDAKPAPGHFELVQKDKKFSPHLLVVPVGSSISFPNRDPFFHNVFSYFNGKRFDLAAVSARQSGHAAAEIQDWFPASLQNCAAKGRMRLRELLPSPLPLRPIRSVKYVVSAIVPSFDCRFAAHPEDRLSS
jgi:hypothetical protein